MHRYHMDIPMYRYLHQIALFGCVLKFPRAQLHSITLYQWRVWNGWLVTDLIHLQHMLALFMMSLMHRLLGTKWQHSWPCFHDFKHWFKFFLKDEKNHMKTLSFFCVGVGGGGGVFLFTQFYQWALVVSLAGLGWVPNKVPSQSSLSQFL